MQIYSATVEALHLLLSGDSVLWQIIGTSLLVSLSALAFTAPIALAVAHVLAYGNFIGQRTILIVLQGLLSFPTVVVGLLLYLLLSRQGPLGAWGLLFTPTAMGLGQSLIAFPVLTVFALAALQKNPPQLRETAKTFGNGTLKTAWLGIKESRFGLMAALLAGFGRIISEVGCALLVGGNIAHYTRNITTAIALDTGKGLFAEGIALGVVLILLAVTASGLLAIVQGNNK